MKLKTLKNTVVNVKNQEEYEELLKIIGIEESPIKWVGEEMFLETNGGRISSFFSKRYYQGVGYKIISLKEFKKLQGLDKKENKIGIHWGTNDHSKTRADIESEIAFITEDMKKYIGTEGYRNCLKRQVEFATEQLKKLDEQEQEEGDWEAGLGESFYYVRSAGDVMGWDINKPTDISSAREFQAAHIKQGNHFKSREEAKRYSLRLQSMARKSYLPKEDDWFYTAQSYGFFKVERYIWKKSVKDQELYLLGRVFKEESEAQEWIEKYSRGWEI